MFHGWPYNLNPTISDSRQRAVYIAVYILESPLRLFLEERRETVVLQWMVRWCKAHLRYVLPPSSSPLSGAVLRGPEHHRKNPAPTVLEEKGEGVVRIAHGEPHDPCPVEGCSGTLLFLHR